MGRETGGLFHCAAHRGVTQERLGGPILYYGQTFKVHKGFVHRITQVPREVKQRFQLDLAAGKLPGLEPVPGGLIERYEVCDLSDPETLLVMYRVPVRPRAAEKFDLLAELLPIIEAAPEVARAWRVRALHLVGEQCAYRHDRSIVAIKVTGQAKRQAVIEKLRDLADWRPDAFRVIKLVGLTTGPEDGSETVDLALMIESAEATLCVFRSAAEVRLWGCDASGKSI